MELNTILQGNCTEVLKTLPSESVDCVVTDPPYELGFMGKSWDNTGIANNVDMWKECLRVLKPGGHLLSFGGTRTYHRMASAIEDAGFEIRDMLCWAYGQGFPKSLNVFKQLQKKCKCGNMDIYENRIKQVGKNREQETEYFLRFMQQANLSQTIGSGKERWEILQSGLSEQGSHSTMLREESKESSEGREERILEGGNNNEKTEGELQGSDISEMSEGISINGEERRIHNATQVSDGSTLEQTTNENGSGASHRPQSEQQQYKQPCAFCKQWGTQATRTLGVGSALKPSIEPICFARKPLEKGLTIAENVLKYGTGGINIDGCRVGTEEKLERVQGNNKETSTPNAPNNGWVSEPQTLGRFPANLIHDGSEEVRECFPDTKTGKAIRSNSGGKTFGGENTKPVMEDLGYEDGGGNASRFFKSIIYTAKASKSERNKGCEGLEEKETKRYGDFEGTEEHAPKLNVKNTNNHPTVKPISLMEYLINMVTKEGQIVLDPFAGSGTTLIAAKKLGRKYIGIELEPEYVKIAEARLNAVQERLIL